MDTAAFLEKILPDSGVYFLATPMAAPYTGLKHHVYHDIVSMAKGVKLLDSQGLSVYHACASYQHSYVETTDASGKTKKQYRKHDNVALVKAFWFDIDCGEGKPYADQVEGFNALKKFVKDTKLQLPSLIVLSGNGLHVYWTLTEALIPSYWKKCANLLKDTAHLYGLKIDDSRTSDQSSILRPAGSTHRKGDPKSVVVHTEKPDVDFNDFYDKLLNAAKAKGYKEQKVEAPKINNEYTTQYDNSEPIHAERIAAGCQQIAQMRDLNGVIPEPQWYDAIGVLRFCVEGREVIQEWSSGHSSYSTEGTDKKIQQHKDGDFGPTTCTKFNGDNPGICERCPKWGKITSPVVLGRDNVEKKVIEIMVADEVMEIIPPPWPYVRMKNGMIGIEEDDGIVKPFIAYDIVPIKRIYDVDAKCAVVRFRVTYPGDTPREFEIPASAVSGRELGAILCGKEIYLGDSAMKQTQGYMLSYLREIQKLSASEKMYSQMGWKDNNTKFVVGATTYSDDGTVSKTKGIRDRGVTDWFSQKGSLDTWVKIADAYNRKGYEAYQFGLLSGFAAPLMALSEYKGTVISLVSPRGGQGKTTIQEGAASVWGDPLKSMLQASDKYLAVMQRIGKYCHLPVCMDELTSMDQAELSAFAYQLSQGRERIRLNSNATEKESDSFWATFVVSSSNSSLLHKVSGIRANSEAEALRIFEFSVINPGVITKQDADQLFHQWRNNYGVAGDIYARYMVTHVAEIKEMILAVRKKVDEMTGAVTNERFWNNAIVLHVVAGMISNSLGLTGYDMKALIQWAVARVFDMRGTVNENISTNVSLVARFLMENIGKRLVASNDGINGKPPVITYAPQQSLIYRVETDAGVVIIPHQILKQYLNQNNGDMIELKRELTEMGALVSGSSKRKLGNGSNIESVRTDCIIFSYDKAGIGVQLHAVDNEADDIRSTK